MTDPAGWRRRTRWRRTLSGIRVRIVAGYALLLLAALGVTVLITRQVQLARVDQEIEQEQAQEVEELRLLADGVDPATGQAFGDDVGRLFEIFLSRNVPSDDEGFYTVVGRDPHRWSNGSPPLFRDPRFATAWAAVSSPTVLTIHSDVAGVGEVRALAVPIELAGEPAGVFVVASFPDDDQREVGQVLRVIVLAGLAVLVITTTMAWSLAGRILRPVRELSSTARSITDSDLSARIPVEGDDELAELGDTFNDMLDRLEAGFADQRRFLDDVAHELRTPITIARGHLEVLGDDPAERAETVAVVTDELDRMSRYVSDLLTLAKAEQPDFLRLRPVDIGDLIADTHQRVAALGDRRWVIDDDTPRPGHFATVADPDRLQQALVNLAANAVQHTADGAEIGLGASTGPGGVRLWVRDTGPGVDPAIAATVFERWTRGATSRSSRPDGAGIGLSIVDAIARAHGARVELATGPGGAIFSLVLPPVADAARAFEGPPLPPPTTPQEVPIP